MLPGRTLITTDASLEAIKKEAYQKGRWDALNGIREISSGRCLDLDKCERYESCLECCLARYEEKIKGEVKS